MDELKKAFTQARVEYGDTVKGAAKRLNVSEAFVHKFFKGESVSAPFEKKIREYIYKAGIVRSIRKLGLDPDAPVKKQTSH